MTVSHDSKITVALAIVIGCMCIAIGGNLVMTKDTNARVSRIEDFLIKKALTYDEHPTAVVPNGLGPNKPTQP